MEISLVKAENNLDAVFSVNILLADIEEEANKNLQQAKHKMNLPGFRPGKIPTTLAKKYLWDNIIRQELEKKLESGIEEYFEENKIDLIRPVLPIESEKEINFKEDTEFEFKYNIGLVEPIIIDPPVLLKKVKKDVAIITEKDIEDEIEKIRHTYGKHTHPETVEDNEFTEVSLKLVELDAEKKELEGGVNKILKEPMKEMNGNLKKLIVGAKVDDEFEVNIHTVFTKKTELIKTLGIDKLAVDDLNNEFKIKVLSIHHEEPSELNEELFSKVGEEVKTVEEFNAKVKELLTAFYDNQSENSLSEDIRMELLEKALVKLPEKFIELLFQEEYAERKDKFTEEQMKEEKTKFEEKIIWSLISERISKDNNLDADEKEILSETYLFLNNYLYMYGQQSLPDNVMAEYITNYLKDKNNLYYMKERVINKKVLENIKSKVTFATREVSVSDLKSMKK